MSNKKSAAKKAETKKEEPVKLNMSFEEAMKKALNTPLPGKTSKKRKSKQLFEKTTPIIDRSCLNFQVNNFCQLGFLTVSLTVVAG